MKHHGMRPWAVMRTGRQKGNAWELPARVSAGEPGVLKSMPGPTSGAGFTLLEVCVAAAVVAAAAVICVQFLTTTLQHGRVLRDQQYARQEAANVMERLAAWPWEELTGERAAEVQISAWAREALPGAVMKVDVLPSAAEPEAQRIVVEISWPDRPHRAGRPVRLVSWRYRAADRDARN